ncbi:MAG: ABC transporter substrate-binding protein [Acidobacteria bacterium]|nr:MAG: ABC transporter substrate-binding protein [Acidobacteriota bacterium]
MGALFVLRRLALGFCLILLAAAILFYGDRGNRKPPTTTIASLGKPEPGRVYKMGVAYFAPDEGADMVFKGLFEALAEQGFVKDRNLQVIFKHANAEIPMIPSVLQSLDDGSLDLIVPLSTPCLAAACKTVRRTPVVFSYVYDPIAAGAGKSLSDHLSHITGVGSFPPLEDTIDVILKIKPGVKAVGTLYNSSEANSVKVISVARELFKKRGIRLEEVTVTGTNEVYQAADVVSSRQVDALWVTGDNTALQAFDAIGKVAEKHHLPLFINDPEFTAKGAVAAIGIGWRQTGYRSGRVAARVLLGEKTSDIPMENYAEKKVVLNDVTAKKLGLSFPEEIRSMASSTERKKLNMYMISYVDSFHVEESERGIMDGFSQAGLAEGRDYTLIRRNSQGDTATLNNIVDNALTEKRDVIFAICTPPLQLAVKRIRDVNVVFTCVADPVAAGAGKSYTDHLPNVTGVSVEADFPGVIRLLKATMPNARRIGTLYTPAEINSVIYKERLEKLAKENGLVLEAVPAYQSSEILNAAEVLCSKGIDAVCQISDNLVGTAFASLGQAARKAKVPVLAMSSDPVQKGYAFAGVARDYYDCGKQSAQIALRVARGTPPATIPFVPPSKTRILINENLARQLKILVPAAVRSQAEIIPGG